MSDCREDMVLVVECGCTPFTPPEVLRACLHRLERTRLKWRCNKQALITIDRYREMIHMWLIMRLDHGGRN